MPGPCAWQRGEAGESGETTPTCRAWWTRAASMDWIASHAPARDPPASYRMGQHRAWLHGEFNTWLL